ncbi:MAG: alpha/beta fold hydrolase [Acidimicrobiales bacterium]
MALSSRSVTVEGTGSVEVGFSDTASRQLVLLLHGGAGPSSVASFADLLVASARVIVPGHPGFGGTPRPAELAGVGTLAGVYRQLIKELEPSDVCVMGNSFGGRIAAEMAIAESAAPERRVNSVALLDAAGLRLDAAPVPDVSGLAGLAPEQIAQLSYFRPERYRIDPATMTDEQRVTRAANLAAMATYGGSAMADPTLLDRLLAITIPVLVAWGEADHMIPVEHGRAYAAAIPGAKLALIRHAGHLPQLEAPIELRSAIAELVASPRQRPTEVQS